MYLAAVKLRQIFFWAALAAGFLALLFPQFLPLWVPLGLAVLCGLVFLYTILYVRRTLRYDLRCPACGWVPFDLDAWKCKECGFVSPRMACVLVVITGMTKRRVCGADEFSPIGNGSIDKASLS
jgi:predicted RNA-binding Zn-ribbon protein involved in translation (DUF1610 family)